MSKRRDGMDGKAVETGLKGTGFNPRLRQTNSKKMVLLLFGSFAADEILL